MLGVSRENVPLFLIILEAEREQAARVPWKGVGHRLPRGRDPLTLRRVRALAPPGRHRGAGRSECGASKCSVFLPVPGIRRKTAA